jgi:prepilin-type N-terminal cleavage/methylation domain-containing protein
MNYRTRRSQSAFTLVEIMIVVAIIGLLAVLAIPSFIKARKQSQGRRAVSDCRQIEAAIDQWALEKGKKDGDDINWDEAQTYLKNGSKYSWTLTFLGGGNFASVIIPVTMTRQVTGYLSTDPLGNRYILNRVGDQPQVGISPETVAALAGVGIDWGPYGVVESPILYEE